MDDILQQTSELKIRLEKVKEYTHRKMLLKQRVPVALNSPKMEIEGEEVAQASETGLEVLVRLVKALCSEPRGLCSQAVILWAILNSLDAKLRAAYVAPLNKEEEEVLDEIQGLTVKTNNEQRTSGLCGKYSRREHPGTRNGIS
ncbi:MAG: hypothetical protein GY820_14215 [Gammaproteobacteria bacterium]|nr:hypothetical protein [Gammaproteobacteria bacterium]